MKLPRKRKKQFKKFFGDRGDIEYLSARIILEVIEMEKFPRVIKYGKLQIVTRSPLAWLTIEDRKDVIKYW